MGQKSLELAVDIAGMTGALVAFCVGLIQYQRAQRWKRAEFLAKEMKELSNDPRATAALTMVDWAVRRIPMRRLGEPGEEGSIVVTYAMQTQALRPHMLEYAARGPHGSEGAADGEQLADYSKEEAAIRDCYDALLDRMDRLGAYLDRRLVSAGDLAPYIRYYVDDIAAITSNATEALWTVGLLTYIHFYHFTNVVSLFRQFQHDIGPDGCLFRKLIEAVRPQDQALAKALQALARQEQASG